MLFDFDDELTEQEKLEFSRRVDVAFAAIPSALRICQRQASLMAEVASLSKVLNSYWLLIAITGAFIFQLVFGTGENNSSALLGVTISVLWFFGKAYVMFLEHEQSKSEENLFILAAAFGGATGSWALFWSLREISRDISLTGNAGFNSENEAFRDWWLWVLPEILACVCESEKVRAVSKSRGWKFSELQHH